MAATPKSHVTLSQRAGWAQDSPISNLMHHALANPDIVSLAAGFVDQASLPVTRTKQAINRLLSDGKLGRAALQYGTTAGYSHLRNLLLERFIQADGAPVSESRLDVEQVIVTAGSNQLLHLVSECLLDPGDIVLCPSPCYFVYLGQLTNLGARSVGIPMDDDGVIPEGLEETLERLEAAGELKRVKAIYIVSSFDNPSGVTLSEERRPQIVEIAKRWSKHHSIHVFDDAAYRELRYEGHDIPSLRSFDEDGDTVIVAHTFSKTFSPGIRVGYGILPPHLVNAVCNFKGNIDFGSPNFAQYLIYTVLEQCLYDAHVEELRALYTAKRDAMLAAADRYLGKMRGVSWVRPKGGLYVWLTVPEDVDTGPNGKLFRAAIDEGVLYVPGQYCYAAEGVPVARNTIRLSFGVQSAENILRGMELLAKALKKVM